MNIIKQIRNSIIPAALVFIATIANAQTAGQKSLSVTVYNQNLGVIKDVRALDIEEGLSEIKITDVAQYIDPTSVHISFDGEVVEQNYQYDLVSLEKILNKYTDKKIELIGEKGEILEGVLLSSFGGQIVLRKNDGGLLMLPKIENYRVSVGSLPEGLITKPTLVWLLSSKTSGSQNVEIDYQTRGMNWHAEYVALLNEDDTEINLNSWVSVENKSGTAYKNAKLKLIAGDVRLVNEGGYPVTAKGRTYEQSVYTDGAITEKSFFEYHMYDLNRPTSLANNETKQISLFQTESIPITKKYLYRSFGYTGGDSKVAVIVEFDNEKKNGLGIPLPKGKVRVYKSDGESVEFVGEDLIDHTPKKNKVKLTIGDAFDIKVTEKETDKTKISDKVFDIKQEIKIKNSKDENVTVQVEKLLPGIWEIRNSSLKYKKKNSATVLFNVPVDAEGETILTFTYRYSY